jgi:hypothetical protein
MGTPDGYSEVRRQFERIGAAMRIPPIVADRNAVDGIVDGRMAHGHEAALCSILRGENDDSGRAPGSVQLSKELIWCE